jgi:menaquinone-specific isochorismate synthase
MESSAGDGALEDPPVAVVGRRMELPSVRSVLRTLDRPRIAWSTADATVAGGGAAVVLTGSGPNRFDEIRRAARATFARLDGPEPVPPAARPRLFGGFAFQDTHDREAPEPWTGFPGARFVLPAVQVTVTSEGTWLTAAATGPEAPADASARLADWADRLETLPAVTPGSPPGIASRRPTPDRPGWRSQVVRALESIENGTLRKVVLAQSLEVHLQRDPAIPDVLSRLGDTYPDCLRFMVAPGGGGTFFGATPEDLLSLRGRAVRTSVLAGSTGRGDTEAEDDWLAEDLRNSEKDRHEHEVVLEAVREQLEPYAASVETGDRRVRQLATVQHLETPVRAELDRERHVLDLVEALHPTPAVGGMPGAAALEAIRETEAFDRGWYAAPVGWIDAAGDGHFAVAIRSAVARDRSVTLFAGAGIVADSDPDREWSELRLKYRPILDELE